MKEEMEGGVHECNCGCGCGCHHMGMDDMGHHHMCSWRVWKTLLVCAAFLFVFWVGLVCGELRTSWDMQSRYLGAGMMQGWEYGGMMRGYYGQPTEVAPTAASQTTTPDQKTK